MGRPPIIISNGGLFTELVKGCSGLKTDTLVMDKMKANLENLNDKARNDEPDRPILREIESNKKKDAKYLWCLASETTKSLKNRFNNWNDLKDKTAELSG